MKSKHEDDLIKMAFFKEAIARSYSEYKTVVDDILEFFVVEHHSPVSIAGGKETPSLTVRSQDGEIALFLFGTKDGCYIQILYNSLAKHSRIAGTDNSALLEMAERLSQIDEIPNRLIQIRGKPVLDLEILTNNLSRRLFIEAIFSLHSFIGGNKSISTPKNSIPENNLSRTPGVIEVWNKLVDLAAEKEEIQYSVLSFDLGVATDPSDAFGEYCIKCVSKFGVKGRRFSASPGRSRAGVVEKGRLPAGWVAAS